MITNIGKSLSLLSRLRRTRVLQNLRQIVEKRIPVKLVSSTYTGGAIVPEVPSSYLYLEILPDLQAKALNEHQDLLVWTHMNWS
jgi:hypothetical protein